MHYIFIIYIDQIHYLLPYVVPIPFSIISFLFSMTFYLHLVCFGFHDVMSLIRFIYRSMGILPLATPLKKMFLPLSANINCLLTLNGSGLVNPSHSRNAHVKLYISFATNSCLLWSIINFALKSYLLPPSHYPSAVAEKYLRLTGKGKVLK